MKRNLCTRDFLPKSLINRFKGTEKRDENLGEEKVFRHDLKMILLERGREKPGDEGGSTIDVAEQAETIYSERKIKREPPNSLLKCRTFRDRF